MRQTVTVRRTEVRTIQLDVPQALSAETLTRLANESLVGVGHPAFGATTSHTITDWAVVKAEPSHQPAAKKKGR